MKRLFLFAAFVAAFAFLTVPVQAQNTLNASGTLKPTPGSNPQQMAPLVRMTGLSGHLKVAIYRIATDTKTLLSDIATGVPVPFWLSLENVGAGRVRVSDTATPTIWSPSIAASETWAPRYYSATTTIQGALMAPDGAVSTISALLEW